jgi:serine kinase of HPr protein (carbohydrate metabolism regulator)
MSGSITLHATCVAVEGQAILIRGPSGSGKSDLALRLIDRGAMLVSDDYTNLSRAADQVIASQPTTIAGKIEVRHIGIIDLPYCPEAPVRLIIDLATAPERLPDPRVEELLGVPISVTVLSPFEASTPIKVEWMLTRLTS